MSKLFSYFIEIFIPDEIRRSGNSYIFLKARILVAILLGALVTCVITYFVAIYLGNFSYNAIVIGGLVTAAMVGFVLLCLNVFKSTSSFEISANLFGFASYSAVTIAICLTGGLTSTPSASIPILVPMVVAVLSSWQSGAFWFAVVVLTYGLFHLANLVGFDFPSMYTEEHNDKMRFINLYVLCIFTGCIVYIFELFRSKVSNGEDTNNQQRVRYFIDERCPLNELAYTTDFRRAFRRESDYATLNDKTLGLAAIQFLPSVSNTTQRVNDNLIKRAGEALLPFVKETDYIVCSNNQCYVILVGRLAKTLGLEKYLRQMLDQVSDGRLASVAIIVRAITLRGEGEDAMPVTVQLQRLLEESDSGEELIVVDAEESATQW